MLDFYGADDANQNPMEVIGHWMRAAESAGENLVDAADLASVDADGMPNIRVVFIREFEDNGLVFYTNYNGQKGIELESGKAALNFYYKEWWRQIRVRGAVEKISSEQSDQYFLSRLEGSRLGAWVSQQSQPLESRELMLAQWEAIDPKKANTRPPHWGGYRIIPSEIEFWAAGEFRLHDRFRWLRDGDGWSVTRLYP